MNVTVKLIEQLRNREEQIFEKVYRKYKSLIYTIVFKFGLKNEINDLVQEVFTKFINYIDNHFPKFNDLKILIVKIAKNTCIDYIRKTATKKIIYSNEICETAEDKNISNSMLNDYKYILTQEEYEMFYYRFIVMYTLKEICLIANYTLDVSKKMSARIIKKIRTYETLKHN